MYSEVLTEHEYQPPIHCPLASHNTIPSELLHSEVHTSVFHKHVILLEASGIQQELYTLTCSELSFLVLLGNARSTTSCNGLPTLVLNALLDCLVYFGTLLKCVSMFLCVCSLVCACYCRVAWCDSPRNELRVVWCELVGMVCVV